MKKILSAMFLSLIGSISNAANHHTHHHASTVSNLTEAPKSFLIYDFKNDTPLATKMPDEILPIASITKLMSIVVYLENTETTDSVISISPQLDSDVIKKTRFKLATDKSYMAKDLITLMMVGSNNNAALAISRSVPNKTRDDFIHLMNEKAKNLNMTHTHFVDPAGLSKNNVSTASDLLKLLNYVRDKKIIKDSSKLPAIKYDLGDGKPFVAKNTNPLISEYGFTAKISKTGYISESGFNLVYSPEKCADKDLGVIVLGFKTKVFRTNFMKKTLSNYSCS